MYRYVYTDVHKYAHIYTLVYIYIYIYIHTHIHIYAFVYKYICLCIYMWIYKCMYIYTHTCICLHTHIHIDLCRFYYFVRNTLVAVLQVACARIYIHVWMHEKSLLSFQILNNSPARQHISHSKPSSFAFVPSGFLNPQKHAHTRTHTWYIISSSDTNRQHNPRTNKHMSINKIRIIQQNTSAHCTM